MNEELNNDVKNILFHIKNNIIPNQLDNIHRYYSVNDFVKDTSNGLFQQIQPLVNELVQQAYKEGFEQGKEFAKSQPNGFN
jgi:hypothetical protein